MSWVESIKLEGDHPLPRFAHAADLLNSDMYIFGGITDIPRFVFHYLAIPKPMICGKLTS
jgi:hypothetical protein